VDALVKMVRWLRSSYRIKQSTSNLADMIKKQSTFPSKLIRKAVDYSGRSVIVVGPKLKKIHQCGLQKKWLELFQPLIRISIKNLLNFLSAKIVQTKSQMWFGMFTLKL
jgi:DNA-directed RNA polymerase subunit beta'